VIPAYVHDQARRYGWPVTAAELPLTIGHRGASGHRRENTLAAFQLAAEMGARMWELDTQLTQDNICVVSHDDHLQRVFGLDVHISQLSFAALRQAVPEVPSFAEVAALARQTDCGLYVELKAAGTGQLVWQELLTQDQRFACIGSFDVAQVRELRDSGCDYPLSVLVRAGHDPHALADRTGADIMHLCWENAGPRPQDLVDAVLIAKATNANRGIVLWHEERPDIIADIIGLPVLGICTDKPDLFAPKAGAI
jgi:glycerophosphoryl diester phosphodiesterase